ncbi:MAG TPA: efflux RND transporter periplasmic adaptor subunit, partial [Chitinophagaceae bacterium]|nr:efflux RND transporter periplasmic adaptor subunit [Chitinophagaceae bacterium]
MKNFSFPYLISILFLGIFASCSSKKSGLEAQAKKGPIAPPVLNTDMFIVAATPLSDNISLPGNILANEVSEIHPEISGRLTLLNIAEGKTVAAGELLGKIYDGDLRAQLSKLSIQLQQAQRTAKRYEELLKIQGVSQQEYDEHLLNISN